MLNDLLLRNAEERDLPYLIRLLVEDALGSTREALSDPLLSSYRKAFQAIIEDKNQTLLVVNYNEDLIGTCHLTFMPSLSFKGS